VAEAEQRSGRSLQGRVRALVALPFVGLVLTGLAAAGGVAPARLRMPAFHLLVACSGVVGTVLVSRVLARRRHRQRRLDVRWGVRLRKPLWIKLEMLGLVLAFAGLLAAVPAAAGLGSVSVGVLLAMSAIAGSGLFVDKMMAPADLTLEDDGLRMHLGAVSFRVPWELITRVEGIGPDHFKGIQLDFADRAAVVASTAPTTPAARARVERMLTTARRGDGASFFLMPWTAGLDGVVLERAIQAGRLRGPQRGTGLN
jgi:hypothetical protein